MSKYISLFPNILRAIEIAAVGGFQITFMAADEDYHVCKLDAEVMGLKIFSNNKRGHLLVQMTPLDDRDALIHGYYKDRETLEDVLIRAEKTREWLLSNKEEEPVIETDGGKTLLEKVMEKLKLSVGVYQYIIDVAVCIAAMDKSKVLRTEHVAEAIQYQCVIDELLEIILL
jgi:hypothetical protein